MHCFISFNYQIVFPQEPSVNRTIKRRRQRALRKADRISAIDQGIKNGNCDPNLKIERNKTMHRLEMDINYLIISEALMVISGETRMKGHHILPSDGAAMDLMKKADEFTNPIATECVTPEQSPAK